MIGQNNHHLPIRVKCLSVLVAATALTGCSIAPNIDAGRLLDHQGMARSLVMSSGLADLNLLRKPKALQPWYTYRNDELPYVSEEIQGSTIEKSFTRTIDRQQINHGRVFDNFHRTSHQIQITTFVK